MNKPNIHKNAMRWVLIPACAVFLSACNELTKTAPSDSVPKESKNFTEQDVEAPEVFQKTANGLWDGRPSLGGVWVAHPNVKQPERVIIRNKVNGKSVIGALFQKSAGSPGPSYQVSSDAASALSVVAGTPTSLSVTALRVEKREAAQASGPKPAPTEDIASTSLDTSVSTRPTKPAPVITTAAVSTTGGTTAPYVQVGLFSVKSNADKTLARIKSKGIGGRLVQASSKGKTFYRVIAGPGKSKAEQSKILSVVKGMGFSDAYFVKG